MAIVLWEGLFAKMIYYMGLIQGFTVLLFELLNLILLANKEKAIDKY